MPRTPKQVSYINGVKHWDCFICKQILPYTDYAKTSNPLSSPHAAYCRKCNSKRPRKAYVPRERKPYKNLIPNETDEQILAALQLWDPSWTMAQLNKAKTEPAAHVVKGGSHVSPKKLESSRNNGRMTRNKPYS